MPIFTLEIWNITLAPSWYGAMYAIGFIIGYFFLRTQVQWKQKDDLENLFFAVFLGVLLGGRIWYILLYNPVFYFENPLEIFFVWKGWMSFHGGFLWVLMAVYIFCKIYSYRYWKIMDKIAVITPVGIWFGRFGNYINNELPGFAPYEWPFAIMINGVWHFPSPLLEMILEWIILFEVLVFFYKKWYEERPWFLSAIFLFWYAISRIFIEQFRLPDKHVGYILGTDFLTLWMCYSFAMILLWGILFLRKK